MRHVMFILVVVFSIVVMSVVFRMSSISYTIRAEQSDKYFSKFYGVESNPSPHNTSNYQYRWADNDAEIYMMRQPFDVGFTIMDVNATTISKNQSVEIIINNQSVAQFAIQPNVFRRYQSLVQRSGSPWELFDTVTFMNKEQMAVESRIITWAFNRIAVTPITKSPYPHGVLLSYLVFVLLLGVWSYRQFSGVIVAHLSGVFGVLLSFIWWSGVQLVVFSGLMYMSLLWFLGGLVLNLFVLYYLYGNLILLQQTLLRTKEIFARFFHPEDQMMFPGLTDKPVTEFTIGHLFSIMIAACTAFVYPMAIFRPEMSEISDRYLVIATLCIAASTFVLLQLAPKFIYKISTFIGTKILLVLVILVFLVFGFREESLNFYIEFLGLGSIILGCLVVLVFVINIFRTTIAANMLQFLMKVLSIFIVLMGLNVVLINGNMIHNFFVINELVTPLTGLHEYSTFIPQYVNLYQYFSQLLDIVGITKYPQLSINIIYVFLQFMSIVTIAIAVYINYHFMHRRSLFVAILFTVPLFFISSRPFWDYDRFYYAVQLFAYSLIPIRLFTVFSVGGIGIWLLHKSNDNHRKMVFFGVICGIVTSIGIYQNNDFGLFAMIGVGSAIMLQPFQPWIKRISLAVTFVVSTLIGFGVLLVLNTDWATLNTDYIFWFQRVFTQGLGSTPIMFPGNGLMIIISIFVIWFCTFNIYLILRRNAAIYSQDPLMAGHFALLIFVATTSVLGMSYYINRSIIAFQGSSMYICWSISLFLLYQLTQRMTVQQPQQLRYSNLAFQLLVLLPVAIALVYTPFYSRLYKNSLPIKTIFTTNPNEMANTPEYDELNIQHINEVYSALKQITPNIAFAGSFANLIQLYTHIPAANIFDQTGNVTINANALNYYCDQIKQMPYDIYITDRKYICNNMLLVKSNKLTSEKMDIFLYINKDYLQNHPQQWKQLHDVANICAITPYNDAVLCPTP